MTRLLLACLCVSYPFICCTICCWPRVGAYCPPCPRIQKSKQNRKALLSLFWRPTIATPFGFASYLEPYSRNTIIFESTYSTVSFYSPGRSSSFVRPSGQWQCPPGHLRDLPASTPRRPQTLETSSTQQLRTPSDRWQIPGGSSPTRHSNMV